jgi:hypothetical protein
MTEYFLLVDAMVTYIPVNPWLTPRGSGKVRRCTADGERAGRVWFSDRKKEEMRGKESLKFQCSKKLKVEDKSRQDGGASAPFCDCLIGKLPGQLSRDYFSRRLYSSELARLLVSLLITLLSSRVDGTAITSLRDLLKASEYAIVGVVLHNVLQAVEKVVPSM